MTCEDCGAKGEGWKIGTTQPFTIWHNGPMARHDTYPPTLANVCPWCQERRLGFPSILSRPMPAEAPWVVEGPRLWYEIPPVLPSIASRLADAGFPPDVAKPLAESIDKSTACVLAAAYELVPSTEAVAYVSAAELEQATTPDLTAALAAKVRRWLREEARRSGSIVPGEIGGATCQGNEFATCGENGCPVCDTDAFLEKVGRDLIAESIKPVEPLKPNDKIGILPRMKKTKPPPAQGSLF